MIGTFSFALPLQADISMQNASDCACLPDLFLCRAIPVFLSYDSFVREGLYTGKLIVSSVYFFSDLVN